MDKLRDLARINISRRAATAGLLSMAVPVQLGAATGAQGAAAKAGVAPLVLSCAKMAVETGPLRVAMRNLYGDAAVILNGGAIDLVGKNRKADLGSNGETQMMRHSVAEPGIRVIMTVAEGHYPVIGRRSAGISTLADLKGKRVLCYRHTTAGFFLHKMLKTVGLSFADVTIVETPLGEVGKVVANREVDAIAIWEPDSEQALHALRAIGEDVVIFSGANVYHERYNLYSTADALANPARRAEIVRFMREVIRVTEGINTDPAVAAEAQEMVAVSGGLYTPVEVAAGWPNVKFVANFDDRLLDVFTEEEAWLAPEEKRKPRSREQLARLIDKSAYEEAKAAQG